jgi:hypothetical protein
MAIRKNQRGLTADRRVTSDEPYIDKDNKIVIPVKKGTPFTQQVKNLLMGKYSNDLNVSNKEVFSTFLDVNALIDAEEGTRIPFVSTLYGNFLINPSSVSIGTFQKMLQIDDVVRRCYELDVATIVDGIGEYYHDVPEIQEFIRRSFKILRGGKDELVRKALSAMWAGFWCGLMMTKKDNDGYTVIEDVMHMPQLSIQFTATPQGDVDDIYQYVYNYPYAGTQNALSIMYSSINNYDYSVGGGATGQGFGNNFGIDSQASLGDMDYPFRTNFINTFGLVKLDKKRIMHFIYDKHNGKINPYGYSLFRDFYQIWIRKTLTVRLQTSAMQRCANPVLIGYADAKKVIDTPMGMMPINAVDALYNTLQTYTEESAVILPGLKGQMFEVDVVDYVANFDVYDKALAYQDRGIESALFVPEGIFSGGGSYAAATAQNSIYARMMNSISNEVEHCILTQFVAFLIHENFDEKTLDFGRFENKLQNLDDQIKQVKIYETLTSQGYMSPKVQSQANIVLKTVGLPELDDAEFKELQAANEAKEPESPSDTTKKTNTKSASDHYTNRSNAEIN